MTKQSFTALIQTSEKWKNSAFVEVPFDVKSVFNSGRPKVKAVFDGQVSYRGTLAKMGTSYHIIILTKDVRKSLEKEVGESVDISLEFDTEERKIQLGEELKQMFLDVPQAKLNFDKLSYTRRKEYASFIASAVKEETRKKRLQKVKLELLG